MKPLEPLYLSYSSRSIGPARRFAAKLALVALCLASLCTRAEAGDHTLDFDGLPSMGSLPGGAIPTSARLFDQYLTTLGVRFSGGSGYLAVVELGLNHATSGTNGLGSSTAGGNLTYGDPGMTFAFYDPSNTSLPGGTDFFSVRGDLMGNGNVATLSAYDAAGSLIASSTFNDAGGETYSVSSPTKNIHRVQFRTVSYVAGGIALDDVSFNSVTPVPEPASLAALGFGVVCLHRRRSGLSRKANDSHDA